MRKHRLWIIVLMLMVFLPILSACEREVTGAEAEAVLIWSEPTVDRIFIGLSSGNYEVFSSGFDSYMQASIPYSCFADWRSGIEDELGEYLSRGVHRVTQQDEFYVVEYLASFEHEKSARIGVAFHKSDHSISHISIEVADFRSSPEPRRECELVTGGA